MYIFSQDVTKRRESCIDALNSDSEVPTQDLAILEPFVLCATDHYSSDVVFRSWYSWVYHLGAQLAENILCGIINLTIN